MFGCKTEKPNGEDNEVLAVFTVIFAKKVYNSLYGKKIKNIASSFFTTFGWICYFYYL